MTKARPQAGHPDSGHKKSPTPSNPPPPALFARGCDGVWVQVPGGWVPDDRVIVGDNLQSSVICLLSYYICLYRAGVSSLRVCCGSDWFHGRRIVTRSCLLAGVVAVCVCFQKLLSLRCILGVTKKKKKKADRTSRQTQAGIGHSAPAHRGGHMQNRISRRQVRRGKIEHRAEAEQPRTD